MRMDSPTVSPDHQGRQAAIVGKRINVCGTSGSGKTTLGKALADRLGLPFTEMDAIQHLPNWQERPLEEFRAMVAEAVSGDAWVIDGNYAKSRDLVWGKAETVIWLDYSLPVILWRLTRRTFRRGIRREELWNGNREEIWRHFLTRDSLYLWVLTTYRRRRRDYARYSEDPKWSHVRFLRFKSPRQTREWLKQVHSQG